MKQSLGLCILWFSVFMGPLSQAGTYWSYDYTNLTVKVTAYFERGSDTKLEGSGLLFRGSDSGQIFVLTSEHVILPAKAPVVHLISSPEGSGADGMSGEAEFVASSWEKGVALLRVTKLNHFNHNLSDIPSLSDLGGGPSDFVSAEGIRLSHVGAAGFPAGSQKMISSDQGIINGTRPEGDVLAKQSVLVAQGLRTEFGMSGGPVSANGSKILGLLTHIAEGAQRTTLIIPFPDIGNWTRNISYSRFRRTLEDAQAQYFSQSKSESVHHIYSNTKIEKRGDQYFLTAPAGFYPMDDLPDGELLSVFRKEMLTKRIRVARVIGVGTATLAEFVGLLQRRSSGIYMVDGEADPQDGRDRDFAPHPNQSVGYALEKNDSHLGHVTGKEWVELPYLESAQSTVYTKIVWLGHPNPETSQKHFNNDDLFSIDSWRTLAAGCTDQGGAFEEVSVPAGRFKTCKIEEQGLRTWYGPVPLTGIVKQETTSGTFKKELIQVVY